MFKKFLSASVVAAVAMASGVAFAQEPPAAPDPQMPATPSMDQKGGGDMAKPADTGKSMKPMHKSMSKKHMSKKHMSKKMMKKKKAM